MDAMVIPLMALLIPIVVAPTAMGIKYARQVRELEHKERMKALELGRTLPRDEPWWTPPRLAAAIGVGVPIGVFACAMLASQGPGRHEEYWAGATAVGMTAVISGSILAGRHYSQRARAEAFAQAGYAKPAVDADAFDVVGTRG
jgi:hypothetical protein